MTFKIFKNISVMKAPGCYDLVKITFVKWSRGRASCVVQPKTAREMEIEKAPPCGS